VRPASSIDEILAAPLGRYFVARSFVVWFQPKLAGAFAFGPLDPADEPQLARLLVTPALAPKYNLLCDFSAIEVFDQRGFELLTTFFAGHASLVANLKRFAGVRPPGLAGIGLAGVFYEKVEPIVEAGLFTDRAEALAWLGYAEAERADVDELIGTVSTVSPVLRQLRSMLFRGVATTTLDQAAAALGISKRSLQRELATAKTSFRSELSRVRVRLAESLLTTTDDKIETIARRLGFTSVPAFTTSFGRIVGETPHDFRRRRSAIRDRTGANS
jgi:AraC-like DNA-binding protein